MAGSSASLTKELVALSVEVPYGYSLLLLNIVTVVGIQSGSFLLVICNFFVAQPKMMSAAIRQMAKVASPSPTASAGVLSGEDLGA